MSEAIWHLGEDTACNMHLSVRGLFPCLFYSRVYNRLEELPLGNSLIVGVYFPLGKPLIVEESLQLNVFIVHSNFLVILLGARHSFLLVMFSFKSYSSFIVII